jgi:hypothetical protein
VSSPNTTANEEADHVVVNNTAARVADEEDLFNGGATTTMTMDNAEDHVMVNNTAEDLFNGGATTTMAGQSRVTPAQPCFYIALSERAPAKVKVTINI